MAARGLHDARVGEHASLAAEKGKEYGVKTFSFLKVLPFTPPLAKQLNLPFSRFWSTFTKGWRGPAFPLRSGASSCTQQAAPETHVLEHFPQNKNRKVSSALHNLARLC